MVTVSPRCPGRVNVVEVSLDDAGGALAAVARITICLAMT
jgi:hypothetical protein